MLLVWFSGSCGPHLNFKEVTQTPASDGSSDECLSFSKENVHISFRSSEVGVI